MAVYIAGPITGDPDAEAKFAETESWLKVSFDSSVINPQKIFSNLAEAVPYETLIKTCCALAAECEIIAVLPGWEKSYGACREVLAYLDAPRKWFPDVQQIGYTFSYWYELANEAYPTSVDELKAACRKRIKEGR